MLTLRKLKEIVEMPGADARIPSYEQLREREIPVCSKKMEDGGEAEIVVYRNGYVAYRIGKRVTVFPINLADDYCYFSVKDMPHNLLGISSAYFEDEVWYLLLILIGEDRLQHNLYCQDQKHCLSFDGGYLQTELDQDGIEEQFIRHEELGELMHTLSPKQRKALKLQLLEGRTHQEIAEIMGLSRTSVTNLLNRALDNLKKSIKAANQKN